VKASVGTRASYQREIDRYVQDTELGITPWRSVTAATVSDWLLTLQTRGLSAKTIINVHGLASASWKEAHKSGDTGVNPFDGLGPKNRQHPEDVAFYLSPEQFRVIYDATPAYYQPFVYVLTATGARVSEILALPAGNVDGENSLIRIRQSWKKSTGHHQYVLGPPKTPRSRRDISVDPLTLSLLITAAKGKDPEAFVFAGKRGGTLNYHHFYQNVWLHIVDSLPKADFPKRPRIHDLRHTHASWLIGAGHNILEVSRRLGHEKVSTTADTYGHLWPTAETGMAADIGGLMATKKP
jgi:integrase